MSAVMKDAFEKAGKLETKTVAKAKQVSLAPNVCIPVIHKVKETPAVAEKRQYIADIPAHMAGLVSRIRGIQSASPEEQNIRSKEFKDLEDEALMHLNSNDELLKSAARQAYAIAMVSTLPIDKRLVLETVKGGHSGLPGLIELKTLEQIDSDEVGNVVTIRIYGETYKVNGPWPFAEKLAGALSVGVAHAAKAAHDQYHGAATELKTQATISIAELLARKPGRPVIDVPDAIPDAKAKDGGKFLPGGVLLVESDGKAIKVIQACGHFRRVIMEIAEAKIFVSVESLDHEQFRGSGRIPDDVFRHCRILHAILRRGIAEAQKAK